MTPINNAVNNNIAKLLATENISVRRETVRTAYFDIKNRNLVLPQWQDLENDVEQMLIGHEVGHALYTSMEYVEVMKTLTFPNAKSYMNILEDVRIERYMKMRYPGLKKTFAIGYKILNDKDFFGTKNKFLSDMILIDRINLHFKVGAYVHVPFNFAEREFINRAELIESAQDMAILAQDIYDYNKDHQQPVYTDPRHYTSDEDGEDEFCDVDDEESSDEEEYDFDDFYNDLDEDDDEDEEDGNEKSDEDSEEKYTSPNNLPNNEKNEEKTEDDELKAPITDDNFKKNVENVSDMETIYRYWNFEEFDYDPLISYKEIINTVETSEIFEFIDKEKHDGVDHDEYVMNFKRESMINVNYLIKEFEMRKAATDYKKNTISKTGSLNTKKLYAYQISEDLFKSITITKDGKNHGLLFLLDWSGSMDENIVKTLEQLINLVMFCQRAQIKFKVLAFSDQIKRRHRNYATRQQCATNYLIEINDSNLALMELFSNEMNAVDFNKMVKYLLSTYTRSNVLYLGGTPLIESLIFMYNYIEKFLDKNNVEKFSLVTLTDGSGNLMRGQFQKNVYSSHGKYVQQRHKIVCQKTKIEYEIEYGDISLHTDLITNMIKNRYKCDVIGFFVVNNNSYDLRTGLRVHYSGIQGHEMQTTIIDMKKQFADKGFAAYTDTAKTIMYFIPVKSLKIDNTDIIVSGEQTARKIANTFVKHMNSRKTSRVLLNNLIGYIA